ncbi:hypothetical protein [Herbinix luporum]|jgi:hypothetical protein|uniref:hypothetical protein n=1 Tax=Herbinix luporum TaxID=1679721 RepID=UPI0012FF6E3D|nr:hypothetical protein [Herbinix luporum]MDI9488022.1 hypothetical protein [Bacillota bacterium]HHT56149.1 hypothetical protein [Herbinix luporum]
MLSESLKGLFDEGTGFEPKYRDYVSDAGQILSECSNYKDLIKDIMMKLND